MEPNEAVKIVREAARVHVDNSLCREVESMTFPENSLQILEALAALEGKRGDERVVAECNRCAYAVRKQLGEWMEDRRYTPEEMVGRILAEIEKGE